MLCLSDPERFTFTETTSNDGRLSCAIPEPAASATIVATNVLLIAVSYPYNVGGARTVNIAACRKR